MSSKLGIKQLENESRVPKNQVETHSHSIHIVFIKRQAILHNLRSAIVVVVVGFDVIFIEFVVILALLLSIISHPTLSLPRPCLFRVYSFYSYYSFHRTLRFVSFSFAVAFIGPMPGNLLLLCHIHTYTYIVHIAYTQPQLHPPAHSHTHPVYVYPYRC